MKKLCIIAKQNKKSIFAHIGDLLLASAVLAAAILSFKYNSILGSPIIGMVVSIALISGAFAMFFLNVAEAEKALKKKFPKMGRWSTFIVSIIYFLIIAQLFMVAAIGINAP